VSPHWGKSAQDKQHLFTESPAPNASHYLAIKPSSVPHSTSNCAWAKLIWSRIYCHQQQCWRPKQSKSPLAYLAAQYFFFIINFLLGYIHYMGGFTVTILIRLILYIIYIASIVSTPQPLRHPTCKASAGGFSVLFHIGLWSPSIIYHQLNLLSSPSPFPLIPHPHTHNTYFTVLIFIINI
jgi:hypothetical protein